MPHTGKMLARTRINHDNRPCGLGCDECNSCGLSRQSRRRGRRWVKKAEQRLWRRDFGL
jgi:hypothetical protein